MAGLLILTAGGLLMLVMAATGLRLRRAGCTITGKSPVSRPLFLAGKAAMGLLWGLALWQASVDLLHGTGGDFIRLEWIGAVLFALGCGVAVAGFSALGLESRFGLPDGYCRLKTSGIYGWCRHPMYVGFYLMALGSCLFVFNALSAGCLVLTVGVHHRVVLAEERFMARHFGPAWLDYAARVRRYGGFPGRMKT